MKRAIGILAAALTLAGGCQSGGGRPGAGYAPPAGSVLTLNAPLTIPGGSVKVTIQDGVALATPDRRRPFCRLEVRTPALVARQVSPGRFRVSRSTRTRDLFARHDNRYLSAALAPGRSLFAEETPVFFLTTLYLDAPQQPDVYRLYCGHRQPPGLGDGGRYLTIAEIRAILGDLFELRVPG